MKNNICLVSCNSFFKELQKTAQGYSDVDVSSYQAPCHHQTDTKLDNTLTQRYEKVVLVGGCMYDERNLDKKMDINKLNNCLYMLCPKTIVDEYIKSGAYIVTPGWLKKWEYFVKELWGFDKAGAVMFYKDFCKKIVLLDTLVYEDSFKRLKEFCSFIDQPYEILFVGLDHFKLYIDGILKDIRYGIKQKQQHEKLNESLKSSADHAMAFDLISRFTGKFEEKEIIESIKEMFIMLFAPKEVTYISIKGTLADIINKEVLDFIKDEELYKEEQNGFYLKLIYNKELLGVVIVKDIAFSKYLRAYLNLAISISGVCALAITNARNYKKNKEIEAQLAQHAKLAAMGEMMGSIAHQWRQPLNELNINIEMLEEYYECEAIDEEFIEKFIDKNTATLRFLSNTITDFSEFFRINKQKEHFSIKQKIDNSFNIISSQLKKRDIKFNVTGDDIEIVGLPNEFQQVLINLINNSKDAIEQKGIENGKITINLLKEKNDAVIEFIDNGGGIDDELLDRIFEPYFTTKEQGKGIGMGLYISKMIIEDNMNGTLEMQNIPSGVKFIIRVDMENED